MKKEQGIIIIVYALGKKHYNFPEYTLCNNLMFSTEIEKVQPLFRIFGRWRPKGGSFYARRVNRPNKMFTSITMIHCHIMEHKKNGNEN